MPSLSITISDALAAKITAHWGDNAAYRQWVKDETRKALRDAAIRTAREDADTDYQTAVTAIIAADNPE